LNAGTALFLLLAFRTNSCYDRWWEGRKLLDGISSKSADLSRMALVFVAPSYPQLAQQLLSWVIVMAHAIKWNLRREKVIDCHRPWSETAPAALRLYGSVSPRCRIEDAEFVVP
jgi:ion channel-forming bestrophin family protein